MSFGARIANGAAWVAVETWGRHAIMFAVFVVLARHLGPQAFGLAALAMVVPVIMVVPVTSGIPDALIQRHEIEPIHLDSAFWLLVAGGAALTALIWLFATTIATIFGEPALAALVRWTSAVVVLQAIEAVPSAVLRRRLHFRVFALRTLTGSIVGGALGVATAMLGFGVWSLVWMQVATAAVEAAVIFLGSGWRPRLRYSHARCRELFGFAGPLLAQSFCYFINDELPKVVLGTFIGPASVGIYSFARRPLELLTQFFIGPLVAVTMPAVARIQGEPDKIDRFFDTAVRIAGLAGFPAFIGFAAIAPAAVPAIFGAHWAVSIIAIQLLMLLGLQRTIDTICAYTILALGHSALILKISLAYMVASLVVLVGAAQFGTNITIAAFIVCTLAFQPLFLVCVRRVAHIDVLRPLAIFPRLAMAAAIMFAAVGVWLHAVPAQTSVALIIAGGIAIGVAAYLGLAAVLLRPELLGARDLVLGLLGRVRAVMPPAPGAP